MTIFERFCNSVICLAVAVFLLSCGEGEGLPAAKADCEGSGNVFPVLDREAASRFAALALKGIGREYPNKPGHVLNGPEEVKSPAALHPAFFGCFDWHSSVHGHWMLIRLLRLFPGLPEEDAIREAVDANLTASNIAIEVTYLGQPNRKSFERTYGWAWLLKLAEELRGWDDSDGRRWSKNLAPLAEAIGAR